MSMGIISKNRSLRDQKPIALRLTSPELGERIASLSNEQGLSLNMTVNMLLGYAFNEIDKQDKKFESKIVFESK